MQLKFGCSAVRQTGPGVNHNLSTMVVCSYVLSFSHQALPQVVPVKE